MYATFASIPCDSFIFLFFQGPKSNVVENPGNTPKKGVKFKMDNYSDFDDSDLDIEKIT